MVITWEFQQKLIASSESLPLKLQLREHSGISPNMMNVVEYEQGMLMKKKNALSKLERAFRNFCCRPSTKRWVRRFSASLRF
jgi:hypothetical protein